MSWKSDLNKKSVEYHIEKYNNATNKQRAQIRKIYLKKDYLINIKKLSWQTVEKNIGMMIASGVDTCFVQRVIRNKKFGFALTKLKFVTLYR